MTDKKDLMKIKFPSAFVVSCARLIIAGELDYKVVDELTLEIDVTDRIKVADLNKRIRAEWRVLVKKGSEWIMVYCGTDDEAHRKFEELAKACQIGTVILAKGTMQIESCVNGTRIRRFA